jgi:hypothetical protein
MCSTVGERLALIGKAIDEVDAAASAGQLSSGQLAELTVRLAHIWTMLAELDPALARRVHDYTADRE